MTTQEAYEYMRVYLTRPGARRSVSGEYCKYETRIAGEVHRCAVGCLLTPETLATVRTVETEIQFMQEVAARNFQGSFTDLVGTYPLPELDDVNQGFLVAAQHVHDVEANWVRGVFEVEKLDAIARDFGLRVVSDVEEGAPREPVLA